MANHNGETGNGSEMRDVGMGDVVGSEMRDVVGFKMLLFRNLDPGSVMFWEARQEFLVTASDMPAAIGVSSLQSRALLYRIKMGLEQGGIFSAMGQEIIEWGKDNEEVAAQAFWSSSKVQSVYPISHYKLSQTGIWIIADDPRFAASPDRIITHLQYKATQLNPMVALLEIKCPGYINKVTGKREIYRDVMERRRPKIEHLVQIMAQLHAVQSQGLTHLDTAYYFVWTPEKSATITIRYSPQGWQLIYERLLQFVEYLDSAQEPPPLKKGERESLSQKLYSLCNFDPTPLT